MFPTWEQFIPNVGIFDSQAGNNQYFLCMIAVQPLKDCSSLVKGLWLGCRIIWYALRLYIPQIYMLDALLFGYLFGGVECLARGGGNILHFVAREEAAEV